MFLSENWNAPLSRSEKVLKCYFCHWHNHSIICALVSHETLSFVKISSCFLILFSSIIFYHILKLLRNFLAGSKGNWSQLLSIFLLTSTQICVHSGFLLETNFVFSLCLHLPKFLYAIIGLSFNCFLSWYIGDAGFSHMYTESWKQHLLCSVQTLFWGGGR